MDDFQMGTLRPVKLRPGATRHTDIDPLGNVTSSLRFRNIEDIGLIEVLDEALLPYTEGADGVGLYDQGGTLLTWFQLMPTNPGLDVRVTPGWGFRSQAGIEAAAAERLQLAHANSGRA